jgi:hypothetical protein
VFGEADRDRGSGFPSRQRQKAKRSGGAAKAAKSRQPQGERRGSKFHLGESGMKFRVSER